MSFVVDASNEKISSAENDGSEAIIWLMGVTSSGKTTIAENFLKRQRKNGVRIIHFDGDEVRDFFGNSLGFSKSERLKVVKTLVHLANKSLDAGCNVIVSALTANQEARQYIRANVRRLVLGYIQCDIEKCAERDPKGLYRLAKAGKISTLIGYNSQYIPPSNPDFTINTDNSSVEESVGLLIDYFQNKIAG